MGKNILIFGAYGFLGCSLSSYLEEKEFIIFRQGRQNNSEYICDPEDRDEVCKLVNSIKPDYVINLIAQTNVDECEENLLTAFNANCRVVENIVFALNKNTFLIHISSDQVYSGIGPHIELNPRPINNYGITKYMSEFIALKRNALVLRTNFVGKSRTEKKSFTDWVIDSYKKKKQIFLFKDVYFSPVHISYLINFIFVALKMRKKGVFNLGSRNGMSKHLFIDKLTNNLNLYNPNIQVIPIKDSKLKAKRPADMRLDSKKFEENFLLELPTIRDTIESVTKDYL